MIIDILDDVSYLINKHLDINSVLLLRKSFRNKYVIMKEHNYVREIEIGSIYYIKEEDNYNVELVINDYVENINYDDLKKIINKYEICGLRLKRCSRGINKLEGNLYLKELVYNLICNEKIDTLCLDIAYFYTLSNYMKRNNKNLNSINIKTICINQIITLMNPYWDLTLYSLKQIIKTFKKLNNILYLDLEFNNLYLNIYKRECELKELKEINDYNNNSRKLGCYLKKNDINLKLKLKLTNEYNIFFKKDKNLKILNNTNI